MSPSSSLPPPPQTLHSPPITIVLTVILLVFFLLGFFSIYFCRCIVEAIFHTWHFRRTPSGHLAGAGASGVNPAQSGLDRAVIKSLPTFLYSSVKEVRKEKYALECAICLAEFNDDSFLRLLTVCYHVFHQDCIDLWLESHKTCPVCRRDLDTPHLFAAKSPDSNHNRPSPAADTRRNDLSSPEDNAVRIDIDANNGEKNDDVLEAVRRWRRRRRRCDRSSRVRSTDERPGLAGDAERFTRSHSTGHSIVRPRDEDEDGEAGVEREEEDRYTLRLPEHVRLRILRARHWTASCEAYKWDHLAARHRFYVSSDYGSPVSDDNSGALVADHPSDQSHHDHHTTLL